LNHGSGVHAVAFAPDGNTLASGGWNMTIKLWDPVRGALVNTLSGHTASVLALAFAPDNHTLASGSSYPEYAIRLWRDPQGARPPTVTYHSGGINELIFTPNNRLLSSGDATARFWNESNGRYLGAITPGVNVSTMALSPDGQLIALPGANHTVTIHRATDGMLVQTLVGHTEDITGLAFSHDGLLLASGAFFDGSNDKIKLWSVSNWSVVRELSGSLLFGPFVSITFSANDIFLSAICEGTPAVWRVSDGTLMQTFGATAGVMQFSPDGTQLAIGSDPIRVYRTADWMQIATLSNQNQALAFTHDGNYLATGGQSQLQFWRVSDWAMQLFFDQELGYPGRGVTSLAFSPDGTRFAFGRDDAVVAVAVNPLGLTAPEYGVPPRRSR
jgi:WD40 repeat protein